MSPDPPLVDWEGALEPPPLPVDWAGAPDAPVEEEPPVYPPVEPGEYPPE